MPNIIAKRSTVTVNREDGFFVDRLDLAIDSTCLVSMNRQRKLKAGKLKKQASTEEMTTSVEEV